jgi:hypothetical protein
MGEMPGWTQPQQPQQPQQPEQPQPSSPPSWSPPSWSPPSWSPPSPGPPPSPPPSTVPGQWGSYPQPTEPPPSWGGWGGWGATGPRPDYKPGIVPLRPLSVGEILDGAFATIRRHPRVVFGFAFVLSALTQLSRVGLRWAMSGVEGPTVLSFPQTPDGRHTVITAGGLTSLILSVLISEIFAALLAGIITVVVGKAILGQRADGRDTIRTVATMWWPLLCVGVVAGVLPDLPLIALAVGPLGFFVAAALCPYLWAKCALIMPAFVLERLGVGTAVTRSWRLVRGAFWRVWGMRALAWLIVSVAGGVLGTPFGLSAYSSLRSGNLPSTGALALASLGNGIVWTLTQPLLAAVLTLIYVDRRMRSEGLDLQLARVASASPMTVSGSL